MKKLMTLFSIFLFCGGSLLAQSVVGECGTVSTIDPNYSPKDFQLFESQFLDTWTKTDAEDIIYVPLTGHLIRKSDSTGGLSEADFLTELAKVNTAYIEGGIQFYLCGHINEIYDDVYYNYDSDEQSALINEHSVTNTINIFVAETAASGGNAVCGYSYYPWTGYDFVVLARSCATNGSTFAHELGHNLGLYHTHDSSQGAELVDGSNCEVAGDLLCDTPADPNVSGKVSGSCIYTGSDLDGNNEPYDPDVTNMMSYARKSCRVHMSVGQQVRAAYHIPQYKDHLECTQNLSGDLTLNNPSVSSTELVAGNAFQVDVNAIYAGSEVSKIYPTVSFFLSLDSTFSGSDKYLGSSTVALSGTNDQGEVSLDIILDSETLEGEYCLLFVIDDGNLIGENNETNNAICVGVSVDGPIAYLISAVSDPVGSGNITGTGVYAYNDAVTLSVEPSSVDWEFVRWIRASGQIVSNFPDYTFNVTDTADFVAVFRSTIGIEESKNQLNLTLFPNPSKDQIKINWSVNNGPVTLEVMNSLGEVVIAKYQVANASETTISVNHLNAGVYFVNVSAEGQMETMRFLKY